MRGSTRKVAEGRKPATFDQIDEGKRAKRKRASSPVGKNRHGALKLGQRNGWMKMDISMLSIWILRLKMRIAMVTVGSFER